MDNKIIRDELFNLMYGKNAHATFEQAVENFPYNFINKKVVGIDHSPWQIIEHMRIAQWDILEFIRNPEYQELEFPVEYWPKEISATFEMWEESILNFKADFSEFIKIINNENTQFFASIPHAKDYTIFREILLLANHNSYHTGQLIFIRKAFNIW
ncbi:MAG: DinB family protein [Bacteroidetes bacterium]|nr:DinB family protein [Bacteroidota bacterium]